LNHIFPISGAVVEKNDKERLLNQNGKVYWLIGLSGSGKSTIAKAVELSLFKEGFLTQLLDGDNLRTGINNNLGFSIEDRDENIRRAAECARLFGNSGIITFCSFICPTNHTQNNARNIIGDDLFVEIFVNCTLEECEKRDTKGLYAKARKGLINDFTGISSPFEEPLNPALTINTFKETIEESHNKLLNFILTTNKRK
jgi:adenylylsulfate kinase